MTLDEYDEYKDEYWDKV